MESALDLRSRSLLCLLHTLSLQRISRDCPAEAKWVSGLKEKDAVNLGFVAGSRACCFGISKGGSKFYELQVCNCVWFCNSRRWLGYGIKFVLFSMLWVQDLASLRAWELETWRGRGVEKVAYIPRRSRSGSECRRYIERSQCIIFRPHIPSSSRQIARWVLL